MADRHALADTRDVMAEERNALADARDQNQGPAASDRRAASRNWAASAGDRAAEAGDAPVDAGMPRGDRAHNPDNPALIPDSLVRSAVRLRHGEAIEDVEELQRTIQELTRFLALETRRADDAERRLAEANRDY